VGACSPPRPVIFTNSCVFYLVKEVYLHEITPSEALLPDLHYLTLAAKYWSKTLDTFDRTLGLTIPGPSSYETLIDVGTDESADPQPD
jgi:hypothetical protein